jgi:hypothetical protein
MSHRFTNLEGIGNRVSVPIPRDEAGYLGRECPVEACLGYFKVKPGTGLTGPGLSCHCPYCGHSGDPNSFWTKEQIEYAKSVVLRKFADAIRKDLKQFEFDHPAKGAFGIGISMKLQPGPLPPLRYYREQKLQTDVVCDKCTLNYSVFGLFASCPHCGNHNSIQILQLNLALVGKQLALAASLEHADLTQHLIEDALENCVSAFDGFGRETCRVRASMSTNPQKASGLSFQNLDRASAAMKDLFGVDLATAIDASMWAQVRRAFFKRHLLAHRSGIIDSKYTQEAGDPTAIIGRRIEVRADEVNDAARTIGELGAALVRLLPRA